MKKTKRNYRDSLFRAIYSGRATRTPPGEFEWTATVININRNHNETLTKNCESLYHYCSFVNRVQENLGKHLTATEGAKATMKANAKVQRICWKILFLKSKSQNGHLSPWKKCSR